MSMQKPPCEPTANISLCVNCIEEEQSEEVTGSPGHTGYSDQDNNLTEEDIGGVDNTGSPDDHLQNHLQNQEGRY